MILDKVKEIKRLLQSVKKQFTFAMHPSTSILDFYSFHDSANNYELLLGHPYKSISEGELRVKAIFEILVGSNIS